MATNEPRFWVDNSNEFSLLVGLVKGIQKNFEFSIRANK